MVFSEYHFAGMPPVLDKIKAGCAQRLPDGLMCRTFGMLEHFRLVLPLAVKFRQFHLVRLPVTPYSQCQVEIGMEIIRHRIAVIEVV